MDNLFLSTLSWITSKKSAIAFCAYIHNFISDTKNRVSRETEELKGKKRRKEAVGRNYGETYSSAADSTRNTKKARKREAATGALPLIGGEKKHFQRIKKGVVLN